MQTIVKALTNTITAWGVVVLIAFGAMANAPSAEYDTGTAAERSAAAEARAAAPKNIPAWKPSDAKRGCVKEHNDVAHDTVLVVTQGNDRVKMGFTEAWMRGTNNNRADNIWVVGFC